MEIELKRIPRYKDAPDESCIWYLVVNGHTLGTFYGGKAKKYEDKYKWALEMIPKRLKVIERNITRLKAELLSWEKEKDDLTPDGY